MKRHSYILIREEKIPTCSMCGKESQYNETYDALFCPECDVWLESTCDDPSCALCCGRPVSPKKVKTHLCKFCGEEIAYNAEYDAGFCPACNIWTESRCNDPSCRSCAERPRRPAMAEVLRDAQRSRRPSTARKAAAMKKMALDYNRWVSQNSIPSDESKEVVAVIARQTGKLRYGGFLPLPDRCETVGTDDGLPLNADITLLLQKAEAGHIPAQTMIGNAFLTGNGIGQNFRQAAKWYLRAAQQKGTETRRARKNLSWCYMNGIGVPKRFDLANYWYRRSFEAFDE